MQGAKACCSYNTTAILKLRPDTTKPIHPKDKAWNYKEGMKTLYKGVVEKTTQSQIRWRAAEIILECVLHPQGKVE